MIDRVIDRIVYPPPLDKNFLPAALVNETYKKIVEDCGKGEKLAIILIRSENEVFTYNTSVLPEKHELSYWTLLFVERLVKTLLWQKGAYKIIIGGPKHIGNYIKRIYSKSGKRAFDVNFMSKVFERNFEIQLTDFEDVPASKEVSRNVGGSLSGNRIGLDIGGSNKKITALKDGKLIFSENISWAPKENSDPEYHYNEIITSIKKAALRLPNIDAIGISSAGIIIDNKIMESSLFLRVSQEDYQRSVKNMLLRIKDEFGGVALVGANDGDVAALSGALSYNLNKVLGISMGTSEAGGYIDEKGEIKGWINELAFIPIDYGSHAFRDDWSGDNGCGVNYLSQDAAIRLAEHVGITFSKGLAPGEKFKVIYEMLQNKNKMVYSIFETIGVYLGYAIAGYSEIYDFNNIILTGGVTSGEAGLIIYTAADKVLNTQFPSLHTRLRIILPEDGNRRTSQSIAAACLPLI